MRTPIFQGSAVAIVTPFRDGTVDTDTLAFLCERQVRGGTQAIVVAGTTGEASTMPDEEHLAAIRCVVEAVDGRVPVIAGTGSNDTRHAVFLTAEAESIGADAILSVTPYYNKASQRGLIRHFSDIAAATSLPVLLYNVPSRTGVNIAPETAAALSRVPNIVGLKECNLLQAAEVAHLCGDDFFLYSGEDGHVLPLLSLGGQGVISVMANLIPEDVQRMVAAWFAGDVVTARRIQLATVPLVKALFCDVNPIPVKAALNLMGLDVGACRMPLCDLSESGLSQVRSALAAYGLPLVEGA